jgi:hypothetical protein
MRLPWKRYHVLITEGRFDDLRIIARHIKRGFGLWRRLRRVICQSTLRKPLDGVLQWADAPRRVLLVVHGHQGRLVAAREAGVDKYIDLARWGEFDDNVEILVFGCESAQFVRTYDLSRRCKSFVGFSEKVRFYTGSALGREALSRVGNMVGDLFMDLGANMNHDFVDKLRACYEGLIKEFGSESTDFARRLVLLELERQLESLGPAA